MTSYTDVSMGDTAARLPHLCRFSARNFNLNLIMTKQVFELRDIL